MSRSKASEAKAAVSRAFGAENRARLLNQWFRTAGVPSAADAWKHVYRLLLWIDRTTGLAHCYESDKSQPGRHWYSRSLAFHRWLSSEFGVEPLALSNQIDWLFKSAVEDLANVVEQRRESLLARAENQRAQFDEAFPEPGDDPELFEIISSTLAARLAAPLPIAVLRALSQRIVEHLRQENKRKNLIGEGFEDVLAAMISRLPGLDHLDVRTRVLLHEIAGFYEPRGSDKVKKVDLVLADRVSGVRRLITAKWSIRADREEQLATDFAEYERREKAGEPFEYVLLTNEFDPARLHAACVRRSGNKQLFNVVVHVNPAGLVAAYDDEPSGSAGKVMDHIQAGRLAGFSEWLSTLAPR